MGVKFNLNTKIPIKNTYRHLIIGLVSYTSF